MKPSSLVRGGLASNLNVDSWRMIDICTCVGVPQRFSDFLAALYQLLFSSKIAQMFSTFSGGAVAQLASSSVGIRGRASTARCRLVPLLRYFLEKLYTLLFKLIKTPRESIAWSTISRDPAGFRGQQNGRWRAVVGYNSQSIARARGTFRTFLNPAKRP